MKKNISHLIRTTLGLSVLSLISCSNLQADQPAGSAQKDAANRTIQTTRTTTIKKVENASGEKITEKTSSNHHLDSNADNSIHNRKIENREGVTAQEQSETASDLEITRKLRATIVQDERLSLDAKNIKIITNGGVLTLKGNVDNLKEMKSIETTARNIKGVKKVNNELLVEKL